MKKAEKSLKETREIEVLASERRNKMRNQRIENLHKKWSVEFELEYLSRMCYNAEYQLWLPRDSIATEEAYTKYALKFMSGEIKHISTKNISHEIMHNIQRKPMIHFYDLPDYYEPESYDEPERENSHYTLAIVEKIKEMLWEEIYEKALWYYRNIWDEQGNNLWKGRNREREKMWAQIRGYISRFLKKLQKNSELREFFETNLELANNYDFI